MNKYKHFLGRFPYRFLRLAAVILLLFSGACKNGNETVKPEMKPITEAVYASGHVVSEPPMCVTFL